MNVAVGQGNARASSRAASLAGRSRSGAPALGPEPKL